MSKISDRFYWLEVAFHFLRVRRFALLKSLSLSVALLISLAQGASGGVAQSPEKAMVNAGYGSTAGSFASLWVAEKKNYFKELGLEVKVIYARGISGVQAMLAGDLHFLYGACTEMMTARKSGADMVILIATSEINIYTIASRPDITSPKQLVGKRVAVNALGDTSHLSARFALKQSGIDPDSVTYVQIGNTPARLAALQSGSVEAALQSAQNVEIIKKTGMNVLINLFERKLPYCGSAVGIRRTFLKSFPNTVEAFVRGIVKGNAFLREGNPAEAKAIMGNYMKLAPSDNRLIAAYDFYAKQYNSKHPALSREGIDFVVQQLSLQDKSWLEWPPERFYDISIVEKLKQEGFLDAVYRQLR